GSADAGLCGHAGRSALGAEAPRPACQSVFERKRVKKRLATPQPDLNDETANPMTDNRNTILAVILSGLVLIAWQYFYNVPQMEKQRAEAQKQAELQKPAQQATPSATPGTTPGSSTTPQPNAAPSSSPRAPPASTVVMSREAAIAATPRIKIDSPKVSGSISLKGARIDDVALNQYRETVDPKSPAIVL